MNAYKRLLPISAITIVVFFQTGCSLDSIPTFFLEKNTEEYELSSNDYELIEAARNYFEGDPGYEVEYIDPKQELIESYYRNLSETELSRFFWGKELETAYGKKAGDDETFEEFEEERKNIHLARTSEISERGSNIYSLELDVHKYGRFEPESYLITLEVKDEMIHFVNSVKHEQEKLLGSFTIPNIPGMLYSEATAEEGIEMLEYMGSEGRRYPMGLLNYEYEDFYYHPLVQGAHPYGSPILKITEDKIYYAYEKGSYLYRYDILNNKQDFTQLYENKFIRDLHFISDKEVVVLLQTKGLYTSETLLGIYNFEMEDFRYIDQELNTKTTGYTEELLTYIQEEGVLILVNSEYVMAGHSHHHIQDHYYTYNLESKVVNLIGSKLSPEATDKDIWNDKSPLYEKYMTYLSKDTKITGCHETELMQNGEIRDLPDAVFWRCFES